MKRKLVIGIGIPVLIVILFIAFVTAYLYVDTPAFDDEPVPEIGNEIGAINSSIDGQIQELFDDSGIPSMEVGILVGDELVWARGYGEQPDLSTVYMIGSIDKPIITTAILQLVEEGLVSLDDDINEYLPFSVRHPDYPDKPVTIQMLLTHTSGLPHDVPGTYYVYRNNGPMVRWLLKHQFRLSILFGQYFFPPTDESTARAFSAENADFWLSEPGTRYQYSNTAFYTLLVGMIKEVTGQSYYECIQENIIEALNMENTSFEISDYPKEQIAIPYEDFGEGRENDLPITGMAASGKIRTNVIDLSQFLLVHMNEGSLGDVQILKPESVELMHGPIISLSIDNFPPSYLDGEGLSWFHFGDDSQGHGGNVAGYSADMLYKEGDETPYGIVILMNYGVSKTPVVWEWWEEYYVGIRELLFEEAEAIAMGQ